MENQKEIAMLEDIRETIADVLVNENWRNLGLKKVDLYIKQSDNCKILKILKKLRNLIEVYELAKARELIRQELRYLKGIEKKSMLKIFIQKVDKILDFYLTEDDYPLILSEPQYNLTDDDIEELKYSFEHWTEIQKARKEKTLLNQLKKWLKKKKL